MKTKIPGLRVTPDEGLVTPEAIEFRIEQLRKECQTPAMYRRIQALKARLPKDPKAVVVVLGVDAALLVSKSELDWGVSTRTIRDLGEDRKDDLYRSGAW